MIHLIGYLIQKQEELIIHPLGGYYLNNYLRLSNRYTIRLEVILRYFMEFVRLYNVILCFLPDIKSWTFNSGKKYIFDRNSIKILASSDIPEYIPNYRTIAVILSIEILINAISVITVYAVIIFVTRFSEITQISKPF